MYIVVGTSIVDTVVVDDNRWGLLWHHHPWKMCTHCIEGRKAAVALNERIQTTQAHEACTREVNNCSVINATMETYLESIVVAPSI